MGSEEYLYFAYGSNLSSLRLKQRLPLVKLKGIATLKGYKLTFNMLSTDGSAKCNIIKSPEESMVYGAVYVLNHEQISHLDDIEGARYDRVQFDVLIGNDDYVSVHCYVANTFVNKELPFDWYKHHVFVGAQEHGFPIDYIEMIKTQKSTADADKKKQALELNIYK
ncbi:gamma-glutamylcyclotransferase family protein [Pseudoalteromonas umbrosa]|uniref:gamma-glutamylcyclotransferase family protein n=1 Tax=Pseudoalteromonas umbrosa TaxID=3048489 RepID=UPI0024C3B275|nr:gamma-glutamylcyclotransferase family protein [Pseudoalteromonas sp. B95]MDK1289477.1 gamma-glutamylcyclotransferase family protein [Pseudoalteromonas sp. B95]